MDNLKQLGICPICAKPVTYPSEIETTTGRLKDDPSKVQRFHKSCLEGKHDLLTDWH